VHPRVNADEQAHLQVHAKHQGDLVPTRVEIESVAAIGAASVHDPEAVPVGRLSGSPVPAGWEGVADQFALDTCWRLDREFEMGLLWGPRARQSRHRIVRGPARCGRRCCFDVDRGNVSREHSSCKVDHLAGLHAWERRGKMPVGQDVVRR
jgi:hypothetical protein